MVLSGWPLKMYDVRSTSNATTATACSSKGPVLPEHVGDGKAELHLGVLLAEPPRGDLLLPYPPHPGAKLATMLLHFGGVDGLSALPPRFVVTAGEWRNRRAFDLPLPKASEELGDSLLSESLLDLPRWEKRVTSIKQECAMLRCTSRHAPCGHQPRASLALSAPRSTHVRHDGRVATQESAGVAHCVGSKRTVRQPTVMPREGHATDIPGEWPRVGPRMQARIAQIALCKVPPGGAVQCFSDGLRQGGKPCVPSVEQVPTHVAQFIAIARG